MRGFDVPSILIGGNRPEYNMGTPVMPEGILGQMPQQMPMQPPQMAPQPQPAPMAPMAPEMQPQGLLPAQEPQMGGLLSGFGQPGGFLEKANNWMTPDRALALQGIGLGLSQMAVGQPANLSPVHEALSKRQRAAQMREAMEAPAIAELFTPQQRAVLAQMPEGMALEIVAGRMFETPKPVQPMSPLGKLEADFRAGLISPEVFEAEMAKQYAEGGQHDLITGEAAAAMGLDPNNAYNRGPDGRIYQIGGGGTTVNVNNAVGDDTWGAPPSNEVWARDPQTGQVLTHVDDEGRQRPVSVPVASGSEREKEREAIASGRYISRRTGNLMRDVRLAVDAMSELPDNIVARAGQSYVPGTPAHRFERLLSTIKNSVAAINIVEMKQAGAGVGAIPQSQWDAFSELEGYLSQDIDLPTLDLVLRDMQDVLLEMMESLPEESVTRTARREIDELRRAIEGATGQGAPAGQAAPPAAGDVVDGWRFRGGDPADQANWERAQ